MKHIISFFVLCLTINTALFGGSTLPDGKLPLVRIDTIIYRHVTARISAPAGSLSPDLLPYGHMVEVLCYGVLDLDKLADSVGMEQALMLRYENSALQDLYRDTEQAFRDENILNRIRTDISEAFVRLHKHRPGIPLPDTIFTHVSGLCQRIVVAPHLLSVSLDYYLGEEYPVYRRFFSAREQRLSTPQRIPLDALLGWLMSEYPEARDRVLTVDDKLRYWADIYTMMRLAFPRVSESELFGFTPSELKWLRKNRKHLLRNAEKREEFSQTAPIFADKYFREQPEGVVLPPESPRLIGPWLGWTLYGRGH